MRRFHFRLRLPHVADSTIDAGPSRAQPLEDGRDVLVPNAWRLAPRTVAMVGRPAVWFSLAIELPRVPLGFTVFAGRTLHWEQDFGGHLFIAITGDDAAQTAIVEAGPRNRNGSGGLVPFGYPENNFAQRGIVDFEPIVIAPPHGLEEAFFAELVQATQRAYDGDQGYMAVELPFLRVGRDSNSYVSGVLLACGVDTRVVPRPRQSMRFEWTGYPGVEDPVHNANFGVYFGAPNRLGDGTVEVPYHNDDGSVRYVVIGGEPGGRARLPDGSDVALDDRGRVVLAAHEAQPHGLPTAHTEPPEHIHTRRRFPEKPSPAGAFITLVVDRRPVPLEPGAMYRGTIVERHDALAIALLRTVDGHDVVLPLAELGPELRDPKRVDRLLRIGNEVSVGLHRDRHPRLVLHGAETVLDRLRWRQFHAPRPVNLIMTGVCVLAVLAAGAVWWRLRS